MSLLQGAARCLSLGVQQPRPPFISTIKTGSYLLHNRFEQTQLNFGHVGQEGC